MGKKVAIIGSGCSGIGALWALQSTDHEVHLFESNSRLGGHTNTVTYEAPNGQTTKVDTGFIVMNTATYPNFIAFLKHIGIPTKRTEMTFGVSRDQGTFEWAGTSLSSIFAQRRNIFSLRMWRLIFDIVRFNQFALDLIREGAKVGDDTTYLTASKPARSGAEQSIGEYLDREGYSQAFRDDYLIPMTAAVWSTSPEKCSLQFPAITLIRFMWNHHLLSTISVRPDWLTIPGGTRQYIDAVMATFPQEHVHIKSRVTSVAPNRDGGVILGVNEQELAFDHVILATHGDEALRILQPVATKEEIDILSGFQTSRNVAILHSDLRFMPRRREAWSTWSYITESPATPSKSRNIDKVCLTYWMNRLQHIPESKYGHVLVTLNPLSPPDPRLSYGIWEYSHPLYNAAAIASQELLPRIQNTRDISYCGAWTKYGFHEDGFSSGLSAAVKHLGAELPFEFVDSTYSRGRSPELTWRDHLLRIFILLIHISMLILSMLVSRLRSPTDRHVAKRQKLQ